MKRKTLFAALAVVMLLAVAASLLLLMNGRGQTNGISMTTPLMNVGHVNIKPVNPQRAEEIKINIPKEMEKPVADALKDGQSMAIGIYAADKNSGENKVVESSKIAATKYDGQGRMLWHKTYEELDASHISHMKLLPDGGFVFTYGARYDGSQQAPQNQFIVFCGANGDIVKEYGWRNYGLFQYLLVTEGGDVFTIGEGDFKNGQLTDDQTEADGCSDVCIMRFSRLRELKYCRKFGGSDFDSPQGALWTEESGLVLTIRAQSKDGDISLTEAEMSSADRSVFLIAAFSDDGEKKWQYLCGGNKAYLPGLLAAVEGGIVAGKSTQGRLSIFKLDCEGRLLWETSIAENESSSSEALSAMKNGCIAVAVHQHTPDHYAGTTQVFMLDADGSIGGKTEPWHFTTISLTEINDGGLILVGSQIVKTLPTPALSSMIYFDVESIATRLNTSLEIQWRKVYDKHKSSRQQDLVMPLASGKVVVEK